MKKPFSSSFSTVKFKTTTASRFKVFSRNIAGSHTEAMETMLDFFENNRISPHDDLGPNMKTLEGNLKKRINAVVAILRDIEKTQTKPLLAMMQLLFQESGSAKKDLKHEKKEFHNKEISDKPSISLLQQENRNLKYKLETDRREIQNILRSVTVARSSFGKPFLRLQLDQNEFESLKSKFL